MIMSTQKPTVSGLLAKLWQNKYIRHAIIVSILAFLGYSFWFSEAWLTLCYGLALFLFGMQCIELGLQQATGGTLERLMAKSTQSPIKGFVFGMSATFILQSSTLVSLLTIAFLSSGMIGLAGGLSIIFGTNLGATSGIWLLAFAGQSLSLNAFALPMLVFGVLMGFLDKRLKPLGQAIIGISLIFLWIDAIKDGFSSANDISFSEINVHGFAEVLIFVVVGFLLTCVLQSSHATLILTLSALAAGQISIAQGFAIAIGSNLGSSATTALVGMLGSDRNGQRLALAHLIFNAVTALISLLLWLPVTYGVAFLANIMNLSELFQLALFHTIFNLLGVLAFWRYKGKFANRLVRALPEEAQDHSLPDTRTPLEPMYLADNMLRATDTALRAANQEIHRLTKLGIELVCHAVYIPPDALYRNTMHLTTPTEPLEKDVKTLYRWQIKPLHGAIVDFLGKMDIENNPKLRDEMSRMHLRAFYVIEIIKDSKHLQKNMHKFLSEPDSAVYADYLALRQRVFEMLIDFLHHYELPRDDESRPVAIKSFIERTEQESDFHGIIFERVRQGKLIGVQASSLLNDINYVQRIASGLGEILQADEYADDELL